MSGFLAIGETLQTKHKTQISKAGACVNAR
jgi:hypothetical protein